GGLGGLEHLLDVEGDVVDLVLELGRDQRRGVVIERLVDGRHHPHVEELLEDVAGLDTHGARQVGDRDHLRNTDDPLRSARDGDLGLLLLLPRQRASLLRPLAPPHEVPLHAVEHVGLLDDLAALLLLGRAVGGRRSAAGAGAAAAGGGAAAAGIGSATGSAGSSAAGGTSASGGGTLASRSSAGGTSLEAESVELGGGRSSLFSTSRAVRRRITFARSRVSVVCSRAVTRWSPPASRSVMTRSATTRSVPTATVGRGTSPSASRTRCTSSS